MGRWGKSNSSFPPSPHPLIPPSSSHAPCPILITTCRTVPAYSTYILS
ncbi:MAG: hypothetical protein RMY29_007110 [Nostoc sp. CreGUA01]|nr:hypothetical protein [Nostoc sp. CreGUA01]